MTDLVNWRRVELEHHPNPIRIELIRQVIPFLALALFIGVALGYAWRMAQG